jgi:hypothetical protein
MRISAREAGDFPFYLKPFFWNHRRASRPDRVSILRRGLLSASSQFWRLCGAKRGLPMVTASRADLLNPNLIEQSRSF